MTENAETVPSTPQTPAKVSRRADIAVTLGILAAVGVGALTFQGMTATPDARTVANQFNADSAWTVVSETEGDRQHFKKWTTRANPEVTPASIESILKDSGFTKPECSDSTTVGFTCSGYSKGNSWIVVAVDPPSKNPNETRIFIATGTA